ncbi:PAS domain S-box protein [Nostoc sp. ChiQUE01b]|uniref:PAS domain-containing protein n=1 Tax=Nostoc sp. ChiQUE01b TaxID=3075376 RepID=UPI002AD349B2|nr:PAS domain S-box protein [Nostoc sp. ChiQUE01b]MDZ8260494.1 PAS domain S-box protein [Nostoc sp. ChiQUE01b]
MKRYLTHLLKLTADRPVGTIAVTILLTLSLFLPLGWSAWNAYQDFHRIVVNDFQLQELTSTITHLDEVLTMSARMNAVTGDSRWDQRYHQFAPQLDNAIKQAMQIAPEAYKQKGVSETDAANLKLVEMEKRSFELTRIGQVEAAAKLLSSPEYERQKQIYAAGIKRSTTAIQNRIQYNFNSFSRNLFLSSIISVVSLLTLIPIWWGVLQLLQKYLRARKASERALAVAKEQLEAVLDAVPGSISWIDSGGVYIGVNRYLAEDWNLSQDAFIGKEVGFLQGSTQLAEFTRKFLLNRQESASQVIEVDLNGSSKYYLVAAQKYQKGTATVTVGIDISDRKRAEEALKIAEENYRSIFENALEGIFQSTSDGKFKSVNPAMARIYGYDSPQQMVNNITNITEQVYVAPEDQADLTRRLTEDGEVKAFEYQAYQKDGSIIWIQEDTRAVRDKSGKLLYYEGIVQNITERKRREQELKRQLEELKVEIDHKKRQQEVAMLTKSDHFQELQSEIASLDVDEFWS